jgi:hypothetical protein
MSTVQVTRHIWNTARKYYKREEYEKDANLVNSLCGRHWTQTHLDSTDQLIYVLIIELPMTNKGAFLAQQVRKRDKNGQYYV